MSRGNEEREIQRNWQHWTHKTQDEDKQNKNKQINKNTKQNTTQKTKTMSMVFILSSIRDEFGVYTLIVKR